MNFELINILYNLLIYEKMYAILKNKNNFIIIKIIYKNIYNLKNY